MALVTDANEGVLVLDHLLNAEAFAGVVIQRTLDFSVGLAKEDLTLVGTHEDLSAFKPAVRRIVLRDVAILLLVHGSAMEGQVFILPHKVLVGGVARDKEDVGVEATELNLSAEGMAVSVVQSLRTHVPLLIDLPDVDHLLGFRAECGEELVVVAAESHGNPSLVQFDIS